MPDRHQDQRSSLPETLLSGQVELERAGGEREQEAQGTQTAITPALNFTNNFSVPRLYGTDFIQNTFTSGTVAELITRC